MTSAVETDLTQKLETSSLHAAQNEIPIGKDAADLIKARANEAFKSTVMISSTSLCSVDWFRWWLRECHGLVQQSDRDPSRCRSLFQSKFCLSTPWMVRLRTDWCEEGLGIRCQIHQSTPVISLSSLRSIDERFRRLIIDVLRHTWL